jgi:XTP/dITP diphosphohydrolase
VPDLGRTLAELTVEEKNRISHRGRALASFRAFLGSTARASAR